MSPCVKDGDILVIAPVKRRFLRLGDMVAVTGPGDEGFVVHRVVGKRKGETLVKADNSLTPDGSVPDFMILGRVNRVERNGRALRIGLGPERMLIAVLSRRGLLMPLIAACRAILRYRKGRSRDGDC